MTARRRAIMWSTLGVVGVAVAMLSVVAWSLARPDTSAGVGLATLREQATASSSASTSVPSSPAAPSSAADPTLSTSTIVTRAGDPEAVAEAARPAAPPVSITVDSVGVDAQVDPVGVESDGSMTIPASPSRVGWYQFGPAPADGAGNTVIAGHVDTAAEGPGALFRLREVNIGDQITVVDAEGVSHLFEVAGKETVVKAALPVEEIFARDGRPLLVLITCGGEFQPELRSYSDNLVVTALPVA